MAFRFSLESVLRLRRSEQRQQEILLQKANEQVNTILRQIEMLETAAFALSPGAQPVTGAELEFAAEQLRLLAMQRAEAESRLGAARERQRFAENEFRRVWQRREALEALCRREQELHHMQENRREQRLQDELFSQRTHGRHLLPGN